MKRSNPSPPCIRRGNKEPLRVNYLGRLMTVKEIAPLVGLHHETVRKRISQGLPVTPTPRHYRANRIEFRGKLLTAREIARKLNRTVGYVYHRLERGIPLEEPRRRGRAGVNLLESGTYAVRDVAGENGKYWEDDLEARVWHLYCGGDDFDAITLREIAALWDLSHEAVRLVEQRALAKLKAKYDSGDPDAVRMIEWMQLRAERRQRQKPSHWAQAEENAPGWFETSVSQ